MSSRFGKLRIIFRGTPPREFQRWANEAVPQHPTDIVMFGTREYRQGRKIVDRCQLRKELISEPHPLRQLVVTREQPNDQPELGNLLCFQSDKDTARIDLYRLVFEGSARWEQRVVFCNMAIRELELSGGMRPVLSLVDCWVEKLSMQADHSFSLEIVDSHIACLTLAAGCLKNLTIQNSSLTSVLYSAGRTRAILKSARFTNVIIPEGISWYNKETGRPDQWAQAKRDLAQLGNDWAAGIFHAKEMSIRTKQNASWIIRFIGGFYEDACDFGNSIARPLLWSGVVSILAFITYWLLDSPSDAPNMEACRGWIESLCREGWSGRLSRALYLGIQPMLNPLGGIVGVTVMMPGLPAYIYSIFHRILFFVLIFLVIVAVRRRFRLTGE
jgi:hypothetical protein